jgi:hypothetical protein
MFNIKTNTYIKKGELHKYKKWNQELWDLKVFGVLADTKLRRQEWLWNAIRINQTTVAKNIFESEPEGKIKVEGPG